MRKKMCKLCKRKEALYVEWSPDGAPDYFCSPEHHEIYIKYWWAKGIGWRAIPLKKI